MQQYLTWPPGAAMAGKVGATSPAHPEWEAGVTPTALNSLGSGLPW